MDNKHARDLSFHGCGLMLDRLYDVHKQLNDSEVVSRADLRVYKFGAEHFNLNSFNKMRVFLAMHILSQTMVRMIKDFCEQDDEYIEEWSALIDVLERIDRLVDICNARLDRGAECLNCPQHKQIFELFSVLQLFEEWKKQVGGFTSEFITRQTYEDLQWLIFGMVGVSCTYLKEDKSRWMNQRRGGSDVCEHFFAKVRQNNTLPTLQQCREITSKISGLSITSNHLFNFNNKSNTAGSKRDASEYLIAVPTSKKARK